MLRCDCNREYNPDIKYKDIRVKCNVCIKNTKAEDVKIKALKYLGGKCVNCGCRHVAALEFHHLDPAKKSFKISGSLKLFRWKELKKELDKCRILCSNCHRIFHYEEKKTRTR